MRGEAKSGEWQPKWKTCHRDGGTTRGQAKNGECRLTSHGAMRAQANVENDKQSKKLAAETQRSNDR